MADSPIRTRETIHQCSTCSKSYKRREHLQRHQATHTADRPHRCPACARSFQRADVLRRHLRSCDGAVPRNSQSITRQRACDRCVRQKKACNTAQPCQNCSKRGLGCVYPTSSTLPQLLDELPVASMSSIIPDTDGPVDRNYEQSVIPASGFFDFPDLEMLASPDQTWQDLFSLNEHEANPTSVEYPYFFQFLDTFTSKSGFVPTFECGTLEQRQSVLANVYRQEQEDWHSTMLSTYDENSSALPDVSSRWLNDPLSLQTHRILLLIKEVVTIRPRNSCVRMVWGPEVEQRCVQFFSPINLRKYMELYWSIWSSNISCIHRPSFDAAACKPILLACIAIIGACVSPDEEDCSNVRPWFNCIEEAVFADDDFNRDPVAPFQPTRDRPKIQALQAAYMVCLYQNWEGTDANKKRVRRNRFSSVVSAVRDIDIAMARHINYNLLQSDEFDWNEFVVREELIRTFMWIFLMDTAFVTFNNNPPRMVAKEMKMHVAAPEACFQAPTAELCFEEIQRWMPSTALCWKVSFRTLFESLCLDDLTGHMRHSVAALGPLNLFTIISGIHSLVFQYQSFFSAGHLLLRTHNALRNFKEIWHVHQADFIGRLPHTTVDESSLTPDNMWKRVGFCRHAGDYWLLAKVKVDRLSAADELQNSSQQTGAVGHHDDESADPILNKYDQTSMRQVNDLISDFQKVHLEEPTTDVNLR